MNSIYWSVKGEEASRTLFRERDPIIDELMKAVEPDVEESLNGLTMDDLYRAFRDVMIRREKKVDRVRSGFSSVKRDSFTVDEKITALKGALRRSGSVKFYDMFGEDSSREEILVTFLALLELIRRHNVSVSQEDAFGEIMIFAGDLDREEEPEDLESGESFENGFES